MQLTHSLKGTWFQPLNLKCDFLVLKFASTSKWVNVYRYDEVFMLRGMIAVPYFEKALYELPEEELTGENIARIADDIEAGGPVQVDPVGARPRLVSTREPVK
jgi:hypothetical protein